MNMINKIVIVCLTFILMSSCSSRDDSTITIIPIKKQQSPFIATTNKLEEIEFAYSEFNQEARKPVCNVGYKLFHDLIGSNETGSYRVKYDESETKHGEIDAQCWIVDFRHNKEKFTKPALTLFYFVFGGAGKGDLNSSELVASRFKQLSEFRMIKSEFNDSIATFKSDDRGHEMQYVSRVINGSNNMRVIISISDDAMSPSISEEKMIQCVQNLELDTVFSNEIVHYKVGPSQRADELVGATALLK